jgi:hypothetical protein
MSLRKTRNNAGSAKAETEAVKWLMDLRHRFRLADFDSLAKLQLPSRFLRRNPRRLSMGSSLMWTAGLRSYNQPSKLI